MVTVEDLAVDDDAGPDPGAHDDAEHHFCIRMLLAHRPEMGFRQGEETVGVVGDEHGDAQPALQIFLERLAVELGGVAVFSSPVWGALAPGVPMPMSAGR